MLREPEFCVQNIYSKLQSHWMRSWRWFRSPDRHCYKSCFKDSMKICFNNIRMWPKRLFFPLSSSVVYLVNTGGHSKSTIGLINWNKIYIQYLVLAILANVCYTNNMIWMIKKCKCMLYINKDSCNFIWVRDKIYHCKTYDVIFLFIENLGAILLGIKR